VFGTGDRRLIALDASSGQRIPGFGDNGEVDLRAGVADNYPKAGYGITSPPAIYRDLVILGPSTQEGPATARAAIRGRLTSEPANSCGDSMRSPNPMNRATTPGDRRVGRSARGPACGV